MTFLTHGNWHTPSSTPSGLNRIAGWPPPWDLFFMTAGCTLAAYKGTDTLFTCSSHYFTQSQPRCLHGIIIAGLEVGFDG